MKDDPRLDKGHAVYIHKPTGRRFVCEVEAGARKGWAPLLWHDVWAVQDYTRAPRPPGQMVWPEQMRDHYELEATNANH